MNNYNFSKTSHKPKNYGFIAFVFILISMFFVFRYINSHETTILADTENNPANYETALEEEKKTLKVGVQSGHWQSENPPDELWKIEYLTGVSYLGMQEWEVNLPISKIVVNNLEKEGIDAKLLPAVVEEDYEADAFISIHADGCEDETVSGFKVAGSSFSMINESENLAQSIEDSFLESTDMQIDYNVTDSMYEYYCFNNVKFHHSISNTTPGAIIEIGFLSNYYDRQMMFYDQELIADAITRGILDFLKQP